MPVSVCIGFKRKAHLSLYIQASVTLVNSLTRLLYSFPMALEQTTGISRKLWSFVTLRSVLWEGGTEFVNTIYINFVPQRPYPGWGGLAGLSTRMREFEPGQLVWDLWWTKWHCDTGFSTYVRFALSVSFHQFSKPMIMWETKKYYLESRSRGISCMKYVNGRRTGFITFCVETAFYNGLLKER